MTSENFLNMIKTCFYFISKTLYALKIFQFLSWLFRHVEKRLNPLSASVALIQKPVNWFALQINLVLDGLIRKIRLIFREVQATWDNEKWSVNKIYNMRNIFLQKSFTKCDGEIVLRSFSKNSKLNVSLDL